MTQPPPPTTRTLSNPNARHRPTATEAGRFAPATRLCASDLAVEEVLRYPDHRPPPPPPVRLPVLFGTPEKVVLCRGYNIVSPEVCTLLHEAHGDGGLESRVRRRRGCGSEWDPVCACSNGAYGCSDTTGREELRAGFRCPRCRPAAWDACAIARFMPERKTTCAPIWTTKMQTKTDGNTNNRWAMDNKFIRGHPPNGGTQGTAVRPGVLCGMGGWMDGWMDGWMGRWISGLWLGLARLAVR